MVRCGAQMQDETPPKVQAPAKPPIGVMPRALWEDGHWHAHQGPPDITAESVRLIEVAQAISRYVLTGGVVSVPLEWLKEVRAITARIDVSRAAACRSLTWERPR